MSSLTPPSPIASSAAALNGAFQPPSKLQAQKQQIMEQAGLIAASNELLLQMIISKQLNQLANRPLIEPRYLDSFSRAIDIKPGLKRSDHP